MLTQQRTEPGTTPALPPYQYRTLTLVLLSIAFFLSLLDRQILTILVDPLKKDLGISDQQFGLIQGLAFGVFYIALSIPIAALADRWNRKLIIAGGLFLWSASTVLAAFARSFGALFTARIGVGLGEACLAPAAYSMFADLYEKKSLARTIGVFHAVGALGVAGASILGGIFYGKFVSGAWVLPAVSLPAWGSTLITVGLPGILLAAIIYLFVREPVRAQLQQQDATVPKVSVAHFFDTLFANGGALGKLLVGSALVHIASNGFLTWAPSYLIRTFELSPAEGGVRMGLGTAIGAIVGPLIGGIAADKLFASSGHRGTITVLVISSIVTTFCYAGLLFADNANAGTVVVALVSVAFSSALAVSATTIQLQAPAYLRARISALWLCLNTIVGLGLGSWLVGLLTDEVFGTQNVRYSLAVVAITSATLGTITLATMLRRPRANAAGEAAITPRP